MNGPLKTITAVQCVTCKKLTPENGYYIILTYRAGKQEGGVLKENVGAADNNIYCDVRCLARHMTEVYSQMLD